MTTRARSKGLVDISQPVEGVTQSLAGLWNGVVGRLEGVVRTLRIESAMRPNLIDAGEATHERFAREEDFPAVKLSPAQSEQLQQVEGRQRRPVKTRARGSKPKRAAKA
jgi:hypothetical protein